jgi:phosphatidate cytidylyltransferase
MLKYRLLFGTLMTLAFLGLVLGDSWIDGSITDSPADDKPVQGTFVFLLIWLLQVLAHRELAALVQAKGLALSAGITTVGAGILATVWYWAPFMGVSPGSCFPYILTGSWVALLVDQYQRRGLTGVIGNCGAGCFAILYLGLLAAFAMAIRMEFGVWAFLMYVLVVKVSDIGAYTAGRWFGRHRFSPLVSPGKTWEGLLGGVVAAVMLALLFSQLFGIMPGYWALALGLCTAPVGQLGDLAESMLKRDAQMKDSSSRIPGFGGVLDILDSPLAVAPVAYVLFILSQRTGS